jgi:uncharacterized protein (TIGR03085 family)
LGVEPIAADIVAERQALADTLAQTGPDAPTLAGAWTAAHIAAHVVSLDRFRGVPTFIGRTVVSRWALRLNDAAGRFADASMKPALRRGLPWAIARLRAAPPGILVRSSVAAVGLFEVFVHHEDLRRASSPSAPRAAPHGLVASVPWLLRYHRSLLTDVTLVVRTAEVERSVGHGPAVIVEGDPGEVVLWLAGRGEVATVRVTGGERAVRQIQAALHI